MLSLYTRQVLATSFYFYILYLDYKLINHCISFHTTLDKPLNPILSLFDRLANNTYIAYLKSRIKLVSHMAM